MFDVVVKPPTHRSIQDETKVKIHTWVLGRYPPIALNLGYPSAGVRSCFWAFAVTSRAIGAKSFMMLDLVVCKDLCD